MHPSTSNVFQQLSDAVRARDTVRAGELLDAHPALRQKLDRPMHGAAFGEPMVMSAVSAGDRDMIALLLAHGADINARSDWWAGSFGVLDGCAPDLAPFLIGHGAVVDAHAAARLGMLPRLMELVSADPGVVHARGGDGQTPLHFASTIEIASYLLDHGADRDARDIDHESTPAQWMLGDRTDIAGFLVTRGCRTDILMAAAVGSVELVRRHLDDSHDSINTRVNAAWFPMRNPRAGGSIYIWTLGKNATAHAVAHAAGHQDVFRLLMERSPDAMKLLVACQVGDEALVNHLVHSHPGLANSLAATERRAIADAASANKGEAVRLMLIAGWPADARGDLGGTSLHHAAWLGNVDMVRDLLRHGAPLEDRGDAYHLTPLGWAIHGSVNSWRKHEGDYAGTVRALLEAGAVAPEGGAGLDASDAVRNVLSS